MNHAFTIKNISEAADISNELCLFTDELNTTPCTHHLVAQFYRKNSINIKKADYNMGMTIELLKSLTNNVFLYYPFALLTLTLSISVLITN